VSPDATGTVVDRDATTRLIRAALVDLHTFNHALPTRVQSPSVTQNDLRDAQSMAEQILAEPVVVTSEGQQWTIDPSVISRHLVIERSPRGERHRSALPSIRNNSPLRCAPRMVKRLIDCRWMP
jgi:hypothetical protein